jgi:hypothetical protein
VIDYIAASATNNAGENFSPHVTIGIGVKAYLDAMLAEPFTAFTFSPVSASVYQFGDYGTARKQLKAFPRKKLRFSTHKRAEWAKLKNFVPLAANARCAMRTADAQPIHYNPWR